MIHIRLHSYLQKQRKTYIHKLIYNEDMMEKVLKFIDRPSYSITYFFIVDGPSNISISPNQHNYRQNEFTIFHTVTCSAYCWPCLFTWTGPQTSLSGAQFSIASFIRDRHGNYTCTARNTNTQTKLTDTISVEVRCKLFLVN